MTAPITHGPPPDGSVGFLHIDMDAFFVSCELLRRPELATEPVVVGGTGARGVVAAASYAARAYGVHSAMPTSRARRLCPQAVFLSGDHAYYSQVSSQVMDTLRDTTPLVEPLSLDEAFLDVRGVLHGTSTREFALSLRSRVLDQHGLTCSVGIASAKFLAKMATESAKPKASASGPVFGSGVYEIEAGEELPFLYSKPVRELWGVGPATATKLERIGVEKIGDIAAQPVARLAKSIGAGSARQLHQLANARDPRPVVVDNTPKSIGHEETFPRDLVDVTKIEREIVRVCDALSTRLHTARTSARTITLKVRFADFSTITRSTTLSGPTDKNHLIRGVATGLLNQVELKQGVRLIGVSLSQLQLDATRQLTLDDIETNRRDDADDIVNAIRDRFGDDSIGPATLASPGQRIDRFVEGQQQWGPDDKHS